MRSVWRELKRRNVVRVATAYCVVGWLLVQVADTIFPALRLPEWTVTFVAGLVILGFPLALILSWAYELTPEGMRRSEDAPPTGNTGNGAGRKIDFAIIGALVVLLFVVVDRYVLEDSESAPDFLPRSIAVLPLENLSPDPDNAYFAAGLHEEILSRLGKLRNLRVISRTSVLRYAEPNMSIPEIARELNVESVMEGSVRYSNDRVRITMQLIDADTDEHLWSETYDQEFSDIFEIESDIAMNVANALQAELSLSEQEIIEKVETESPTAYAFYLRALSMQNQGSEDYFIAIDQAIAADPNFALAYASRAVNSTFELVGVGVGTSLEEALELERRTYTDSERALLLDPTLGLAHAAQAAVHQANWRGTAAEQAFQRALQLSPNDVYVLLLYSRFKRYRGEYDEAVRLLRRATELDPNDYSLHAQLAFVYRDSADWDAAAEQMGLALAQNPANPAWNINLGYIEAARGNSAEAARILRLAEQLGTPSVFRLAQIAQNYALAGYLEDARRVFADFEEQATQAGVSNTRWAQAYMAVGDYQQALRRIELAVNERFCLDQAALAFFAANSSGNAQLSSPEFRALLDSLWDDS
jgi:adenylate cyclase